MYTEKELKEQFNDAFKDGIDQYVLILDDEGSYSIINSVREMMMIVEEKQVADFFINRLLEMNIKVYDSIKSIPGWGTKEPEPPAEMHPLFKDLLGQLSAKSKNKKKDKGK